MWPAAVFKRWFQLSFSCLHPNGFHQAVKALTDFKDENVCYILSTRSELMWMCVLSIDQQGATPLVMRLWIVCMHFWKSLLTWFITSVGSFVKSLWSLTQVSNSLQYSRRFRQNMRSSVNYAHSWHQNVTMETDMMPDSTFHKAWKHTLARNIDYFASSVRSDSFYVVWNVKCRNASKHSMKVNTNQIFSPSCVWN